MMSLPEMAHAWIAIAPSLKATLPRVSGPSAARLVAIVRFHTPQLGVQTGANLVRDVFRRRLIAKS